MSEAAGQGVFGEVARVYRDSRKAHDIAWNVYVARPIAALLVVILRRTPLTPNQVTILGALVFVGCIVPLVMWPGWYGFLVAAAVLELAYFFDCADGQLARVTGKTSEVGAYFDFLIDEVKALLLVGGCSVRIWMGGGETCWLIVGIAGCALVSIATSLTNFIRRPEYAGATIKPGASAKQPGMPPGFVPKIVWAVRRTASFVVHYPSWFVFVALADGIEGFDGARWFLYLFLGVYVLYVAQTGLGVVLKLGSPSYYES